MSEVRGRIVYIEPNSIQSELSQEGSQYERADNIAWNPEDLNISVDLQVVIPDRDACGKYLDAKFNVEVMDSNSPLQKQMQSFLSGNDLGGGKQYLTTEYTDITYQEIRSGQKGAKECLGIESIDIKFDANFYPQVSMKFVDVRGLSLMQPLEQGYIEDMEKRIGTCQSFFNSLFHYPFPRFYLSVKGFYGNRITYVLSVSDMKSNFNGNTGNFDVTVNFIGNMYGVYSDIPLNYLIAAPYFGSSDGTYSDYWKSQIASGGNFTYADGKTPIMTFIDFIKAYDDMANKLKEQTTDGHSNYKSLAEVENLTIEYNLLKNLKNGYETLVSKIGYDDKGKSQFGKSLNIGRYIIYFLNSDTINFQYYSDFFETYDVYQANDNVKNKIGIPERLNKDKWSKKPSTEDNIFIQGGIFNEEHPYYKLLKNESDLKKLKSAYDDLKNYNHCYLYEKEEDFVKKIDERITQIEGEKKQLIEDNSAEIKQITEDILGFSPTIENIFRMIYAHVDAFMHDYYTLLHEIDGQRNGTRNCKKLGIDVRKTDLNGEDCFVPPFPGINEPNEEEKLVRKYPGDMQGAISNIAEVEYINKFFAGIEGTNESLGKEDKSSDIETPSMQAEPTQNFIPTILSDIFYEGINPYTYFSYENGSFEAFKELLYVFCCRYLAKEIKTFSTSSNQFIKLEAENFDMLYHNTFANNDEFKSYLRDFPDKIFSDAKKPAFLKENGILSYNSEKSTNEKIVFSNKNEEVPIVLKSTTDGGKNKNYSEIIGFTEIKTSDNFISDFQNKVNGISDKSPSNYIDTDWKYDTNRWSGLRKYSNGKFDTSTRKYNEIVHAIKNGNGDGYYVHKVSSKDNMDILWQWIVDKEAEEAKKEAENPKYERKQLMPDDLTILDAANFLSAFVGSKDVFRVKPQGGILKMPKYVALYLGSQLYCKVNGKDVSEWPFSITEWGRFTNFTTGNPANKVNNKEIYEILDYDINRTLVFLFMNWYVKEFKNLLPIDLRIAKDKNDEGGILYTEEAEFILEHQPTLVYAERLTDFYLEDIVFFADRIVRAERELSITKTIIKNFCNELLTLLEADSEQTVETNSNNPITGGYDKVGNKEEFYYRLKELYDRWLCSFNENRFKLYSPEKDKNISKRKNNGENPKEITEFNSFVFRDSAFRDIGDKCMIDPGTLYELLTSQIGGTERKNRSLLEFITDIAYKNRLQFLALPVLNNLYDKDGIVEIFSPHTIYDGTHRESRGIGNTYVLLYPGEPSKTSNASKENKNGVGYRDDGYDLADSLGKITDEAISTIKGDGDNITAFGVTFGKQNQMYFTSISPSMDTPRQTDYAIANTFRLAESGSNGNTTSPVTVGQNMFSVFSNRSYDCTVDMLGCANIMPLMYFQLNNIPMFKGAYMIYKVEHHITANKMTTRFVGQRQSKYTIAFKSDCINLLSLYERINNVAEEELPNFEEVEESTVATEVTNSDFSAFLQSNNISEDTVFNAAKAIQRTMQPMALSSGTRTPFSHVDSSGYCAQATKIAVLEGFDNNEFKKKLSGGCNAWACRDVYQKAGFKNIKTFDKSSTREDRKNWITKNCEPGDIAIMSHGTYGHICIYTDMNNGGRPWISDFAHQEPWVYNNGVLDGSNMINIYRFAGKRILPQGYITIHCLKNEVFNMEIGEEVYKDKTIKVEDNTQPFNVTLARADGKTDDFKIIIKNGAGNKIGKTIKIEGGSGEISIPLNEGDITIEKYNGWF